VVTLIYKYKMSLVKFFTYGIPEHPQNGDVSFSGGFDGQAIRKKCVLKNRLL